jgi:hypothetical protein
LVDKDIDPPVRVTGISTIAENTAVVLAAYVQVAVGADGNASGAIQPRVCETRDCWVEKAHPWDELRARAIDPNEAAATAPAAVAARDDEVGRGTADSEEETNHHTEDHRAHAHHGNFSFLEIGTTKRESQTPAIHSNL